MFETPYGREAMSACNPEAVLTSTEMKHEEKIREREMGGRYFICARWVFAYRKRGGTNRATSALPRHQEDAIKIDTIARRKQEVTIPLVLH